MTEGTKHRHVLAGILALLAISSCVGGPPRAAGAAAHGGGATAPILDPPRPVSHELEDRGYDALHYRIEIQLPHDRAAFRGAMTLRLRATRQLRTVVLDAADMTITSVMVDAHPTDHAHDNRLLTVDLPRTLAAGREAAVRVEYQVRDPLGGLHFSLPGESGVPDAVPQVFTQGEDIRARHWFPCFDAPHERASHELIVTAPISWQVIGAGRQLAREADASAGTATTAWRMDEDMPCYLFTLAAGPFVSVADRWEDVEIAHWVEPGDLEAAGATFARTADVLGFLSDYTGFRYPFPKYAHVAVRDFPFGGMENVTATTVTRNAIRPAADRPEGAWGLVAHEAAHQWFGDVVTCESWPHAWLNEGFATYFTSLYQRHAFGEQDFLYGIGRTLDGYLDACQGENLRAVVKEEYRLPMDLFFDGTIYPGGAARLQLLRGLMGEDDFREGVRLYLERNAFRSVPTAAFATAMSAASGLDLRDWFAQWVYAPGYPVLEASWSLDAAGDARVELRQTQSGAGVPPAFRFPLEIAWSEDSGPRIQRLSVDEARESWTLDLGAGFSGFLEFDPQVWVPARWIVREDFAATLARAGLAGSPRARSLACRDLAAAGGTETALALFERAERDPVAGLRAEAIALLGQGLQRADLPRALAASATEQDLQARAAWWDALARFADDPALNELFAGALSDREAPADLREIALRGLAGLLQGEELRAFLLPVLRDHAETVELRALALRTLAAELRDAATHGVVLRYSWSGNVTELRTAALQALAPWLEEASESDVAAMGVVDSHRRALSSGNVVLRRAAAEAAGRHPQWFRREIAELLRREPDARIRRLLEAGAAR